MYGNPRTLQSWLTAGVLVFCLGTAPFSTAQKSASHPRPAAKTAPAPADIPLTSRDQALQMLNRFTFGPRPGEVEKILAQGQDGPQKWFERQLNPAAIDDTALDKRLGAFPTLNMPPEQILTIFPDRGTIQRVAEGKQPYPSDPQLAGMYEVQVYKYNQEIDARKANLPPAPTGADAAKLPQTIEDKATAARIAGELFSIPANQRMASLLARPVTDRIAFTRYVDGEQKNTLLNDFTPRERELFYAMGSNVGPSYQAVSELQQARILRDILSERQLQAVMADFWFNHFNIYAPKDSDQWYTTGYERDAIRKNALGKFRDLLLATAESPAMMVYLDNWLSIGPNSLANGVNPANPKSKPGNRGLNENYAREVMELHTLSVNGGYTQADVTHLAAMLTGWSVDRPNQAGPFAYDPKKHEPGAKQWLGQTIPDGGPNEGLNALKTLAASPKTAHFISWKLAQRFVADDPPPALVDRMAQTYLNSDGDIKAILRTMVQSPEFNSRKYFRNKVKTPVEFVASTFRATATDPINPNALAAAIDRMGMPLYRALPPTGYYITADKWMNTNAILDRLNFALQLTASKIGNQKFDSPRLLALGLLSQPAGTTPATASAIGASQQRPANPPAHAVKIAEAMPATEGKPETPTGGATDTSVTTGTGAELALSVLETTLIGSGVSAQTNRLIRQQLAQPQATGAPDTLNTLTALVLGAPEFQLR